MTGMNLMHKQFLITVISVCVVTVGCSNSIVLDNKQQTGIIYEERFSTQSSEDEVLYTESTQADELEELEQQMSGMEEKPCPTYSSEKTLFQLLDLEIGDSEEKIIEMYGEPDSRCYEVVGTYQLHEQSLFTYMTYDDKMIVVRKYFDETKDYDNQNGIVEIELKEGNYESTKGIKIGDSIAEVQNKYGIQYIYDYGEFDGLVSTMIYNRVERIRDIMDREFFYEYGEFDKVAYVLSSVRYEEHCNIPAVIFLINDGKVIRIIVMNTDDF